MGERDHFISMEMAAIGMEMMAEWGTQAIAARLSMLTARIAEGLSGGQVRLMETRFRAPHILSLGFPGGLPAGLVEGLGRGRGLCCTAVVAHAHLAACLQRRGRC